MKLLENVGTLFFVLAIFVFVFYWVGGFELLRFLNARKLKSQILTPSQSPLIREKINVLKSGNLETLTVLETRLVADAIVGDEAWVERLYDKHAKNTNVRYLYGVFLIRKGWLARGAGDVSSIRAEDLDTFVNALQRAEFVLSPLLDTGGQLKPAVLEQLLLIYKGIAKREDAQHLYAQYVPTHKTALTVHLVKIGQMAERWGGERAQMFQEARALSKNGKSMSVILAAAWVELAIDESRKSMKNGLDQSEDKAFILDTFKALPSVSKQLDDVEDYNIVQAYNIYAAYFHLLGDKKNAKEALRKTTGYYVAYPWKYLHENPKDAYIKVLAESKVTSFLSLT